MTNSRTAIVLTGGGARGAYQAGALKAIGQIAGQQRISRPFDIYAGNSAGAINSAWLVSHADQFEHATQRLSDFWEGLSTDQIFKTDFKSLIGRGARWILELGTGGLYEKKAVHSLFETSPLLRVILREIRFGKIKENIDSGLVSALALTAVNYSTGNSRVFHYSNNTARSWVKVRRDSVETEITAKHVMASASIPILFAPVQIGTDYFGDGSLRNYTPVSPAIHLGADRVMVIGVRAKDSVIDRVPKHPSLARILSVLLNFVLLDAVDYDFQSLNRINQLLGDDLSQSYRKVDVMMIRPTIDIGNLAKKNVGAAPFLLRYFIRGLGTDAEASDLISYLLFETPFLSELTTLGYEDTMAQKDAIADFINSGK